MPEHKTPEALSETTAEAPAPAPVLVTQPEKITGLLELIDGFVSENVTEDKSQDMGGGSSTGDDDSSTQPSPREIALQNLPPAPQMQKKVAEHIETRIVRLRKEVKRIERLSKKGSAYRLSALYARLRFLNTLLTSIWKASETTIRRLFIRVFIDKQKIMDK